MLTKEEKLKAQILVDDQIITIEQLRQAIRYKEKLHSAKIYKDLLTILLEKGDITLDQKIRLERLFSYSQTPPQHLGGYKIIEKIGEGGMSDVYKAIQLSMNRVVALKILHPQAARNAEYIERFFREAQFSAKLQHPNIVQGIDAGRVDGFFYFSMEYIDGIDVAKYLKNHKYFEEKEAAQIILQIAKALEYASQFHILHRDIKPQNIFLTHDGLAKLGDLGLSKYQDDGSLTKTGIVMGTPHYISPEQLTHPDDVDTRSDIYSLGITFFEMLTGVLPYSNTSSLLAMAKRISQGLPSVQKYRPQLSNPITQIVKKMTQPNRAERYKNPSELIDDLLLYLEGKSLPLPQPQPHSKAEILVVDDSKVVRHLLTLTLQENQYSVSTAKDGAEALEILKQKNFDLIISDLNMPKINGFELAKKKSELGISTPMIFLTSEDSEEMEMEGFDLGAEDYLIKPIKEKRLLARVKKILNRS
ncbi:MAG: response regulator [Planctomycetota bacterium]|nr:MAG: response regulator [Planctomycetota bacterium]